MDFLLELVFEIILEGAIEAASDTKVPMPIRILLATVLLGLYLGLVVLIVYIGISNKNGLVIAIGIFLSLLIAGAVWYKCLKFKNRTDE